MCSPVEIGEDWTDEQRMQFLTERRSEDPLPCNVIDDVNPFSVEPWSVPDNRWFLCNAGLSDCNNEGTRDVATGYWKETGSDKRIYPGSATGGRKIFWEFYLGVAPFGDKTGWTLVEYQMENGELFEVKNKKDFSSLCNVYWSNVNIPFVEEDHNITGVDDAEGDFLQLILLNMLDEDRNSSFQEPANGPQVGHQDEQQLLPLRRGKQDLGPLDSNLHVSCDISSGDFLELKDFEDIESSSSSSDNSSCFSGNSDDYFDSEALLRSLEYEYDQNIQEGQKDCNHRILRSISPEPIATKLQPPGSILQNENVESVLCTSGPVSQQEEKPDASSSTSALLCVGYNSTVSKREEIRAKRAASRSPQSSGSSQASGTRAVGRIAKLGKKYCCFRPF